MARRPPQLTKRERKAHAADPAGPGPEPSKRLKALAKRYGVAPENLVLAGLPGLGTMSDVISEWAEPLLGPLEDAPLKSFRSGLAVAMLIWNEASAPGSAAAVAATVLEMLGAVGGAVPKGTEALVERLIESRRTRYASDPRIVLETEAEDVGDDRRMRVVSGVRPA